MSFGDKLRKLRRQAGHTQEALGDLLGVSARTIQKYESEKSYPSFEQLPKIAKLYGITIDQLVREEDEFVIQAYEVNGIKGAKEASDLVNGVCALFAGGRLSPEDRTAAMKAISEAYFIAYSKNGKSTTKNS